MAGGILIAILIISALLLMITNIGDYQITKDISAKSTQIAKFNRDFERYTDDNGIKGTDIVSLINKIADYNLKQTNNTSSSSGSTNYVDYNIRMSITIRGLDRFNTKYANDNTSPSNQLFPTNLYNNGSYKFGLNTGNAIKERLNAISDLEKNNPRAALKQWSSIYDARKTNSQNEEAIKEYLKNERNVEDWDEISSDYDIDMDSIKLYTQFSEFKTAKFSSYQDPVYENDWEGFTSSIFICRFWSNIS